ncbi:McrB family protein [Mesonia mobilis]|uniref:McrB family protein n=1 Tax=Mesonia mobilis TaxID=369791 RepID=UPI0026EEC4BD|nr:AAA family ATPase [Mesonia mobilis]
MNNKEFQIWQKVIQEVLTENKDWPKANESDRYYVIHKDVKMPPKIVFARAKKVIANHHPEIKLKNIGGGVATNQFLENFGFKVIEELHYNRSHQKKLSQYLTGKVSRKAILQHWINYGYKVLSEVEIAPYKVRMAIEADHHLSIVLGKRPVLKYIENKGEVEVAFVVSKDFYKNHQVDNDFTYNYEYQGKPDQNLIKIKLTSWADIPQQLFEEHTYQVKRLYNTVKNEKITQWQYEAGTTNQALKYILFKKESIESFMRSDQTAKMSVKKEFIDWLIEKQKVNYFGNKRDTINKNLDKYNTYFEIDLYEVNKENYRQVINLILKNAYEDEQSDFFQYSKAESSHRPRAILGKENYFKFLQEKFNPADEVVLPLNQILYGPPGTGKTFKLQQEYFNQFTVSESSLTKEQYIENAVAELTWWQTFAVALYDLGLSGSTEILNHEIVKAKERQSSAKSIKPILWSRLQAHTVLDCPNVNVKTRSELQLFYKNETSKWRVHDDLLKEAYPEALEILDKIKNYQPDAGKIIKNYEFVTFHQSFGYEDFVEGIKPKMEEQSTDLEYEIQDGVFKRIALKAKADPENKYAIFIDEINRGNVSAIFGELITLIEKDKRLGEPNALEVKLPYSRTSFGVPSNLYIIGTMNTADRSVEALDTALRRRFAFEELLPKPELFEGLEVGGISIQEVLEKINQRIEALVDRDHTIGHAYFFKVKDAVNKEEALKQVFKDNIIPLLQEYFYGDYSRIGLVLGGGFVEVERRENSTRFANVEGLENELEVSPRIQLIPINEAFDMGKALQNLMQDA